MPTSQVEGNLVNGYDAHPNHPPAKGAKSRATSGSGMDSNEASRLLQARISQLEQDAAGEKDQELEIGKISYPGIFEIDRSRMLRDSCH